MIQLFRQSARSLARRPGFTALVLLILALCIGGNASMFSVADAVLFRELPYKEIDRLVVLSSFYVPNQTQTDLSWVEAMDWGRRSKLLEKVSPFMCSQERLIVQKDSVERIQISHGPSTFLQLMGVQPQLGRLFTPEEDKAPGGAPVIILTHSLWERVFQRDPRIVGKSIQLNDRPYTVVGVLPEKFVDFMEWRRPIDAWIPASMIGDTLPPDLAVFESREERLWFAVARLKPGVTFEQAQQEGDAIFTQLEQEFPSTNKDYKSFVIPLRQFIFPDVYEGTRVLVGGAILVLLIGCANIANLLMVRVAERRRELSLRLALGAGRQQVLQHVFAESLILAVVGGALGVLFAVWGTRLLAGLMELPPFTEITLDGSVLAFSVAAALLTGFLFTLPPALRVRRLESKETLQIIRSGGRTSTSRGLHSSLVFQISLVVILLIVANLLLRSFWQLRTLDLGFETDRLLTMRMGFGAEQYTDRSLVSAAMMEVLRRAEEVPGVADAAIWGTTMPGISTVFTELQREGAAPDDLMFRADLHLISPGALSVLGIPVKRGREFTPQDTREVPRIAMVSQSLADAMWPGQDPIGKRFYRPNRENGALVTVVGTIPDIRLHGRFVEGNGPRHQLLFPNGQVPGQEGYLMVRTSTDMGTMAEKMKEVIRQVDSQVPIFDIQSMEDRLRDEEKAQRVNAVVVFGYSLLALVLAMLGLYGMLAYSVVQRTREIGVRIALGANPMGVLALIMGRGLALVGGGILLGLAGALAVTRLISSQLFGVTARDPLTFIAVILAFIAIAVFATYLPARRAVKVKPTIALRYE